MDVGGSHWTVQWDLPVLSVQVHKPSKLKMDYFSGLDKCAQKVTVLFIMWLV